MKKTQIKAVIKMVYVEKMRTKESERAIEKYGRKIKIKCQW